MSTIELANRLGISYSVVSTLIRRPEFSKFLKPISTSRFLIVVDDDFKEPLLEILIKKRDRLFETSRLWETYEELINSNLSCLD